MYLILNFEYGLKEVVTHGQNSHEDPEKPVIVQEPGRFIWKRHSVFSKGHRVP